MPYQNRIALIEIDIGNTDWSAIAAKGQFIAPYPERSSLSTVSHIVLVGGGNMGNAMAECWRHSSSLAQARIHVVDPNGASLGTSDGRACLYASPGELPDGLPDAVVFAVKPQLMREVVPHYRRFASKTVFVSVAAGVGMASLEAMLGPVPIVRAMPNVAASIARSTSVLCRNRHAAEENMSLVETLFAAMGTTHMVESEDLLDKATAIAGSGPAYVFYFIECLARAAGSLGVDSELALALSREVVAGAAELCLRSTATPEALRQRVCSPNGTTVAALASLLADDAFAEMVRRAVEAASGRATELSSLN